MARLVFPGSPSDGDKHEHAGKIFQYLARKNRWDAVGTTAVSATKAEELETRLATIETEGSGTGTEAIANASLLSLSDLEAGAMSFDQENNRLYITNGTGWYSIALVNEAPSITFASNAEFTMGEAGANTVDLTYTVVEPEGTPTFVTVSNTGLANTSVANIQHFTSNNTIRVNNFYANTEVELNGIIRATVSDGINLGITSAPFIISNSTELYSFTSFTFDSGGASGRNGPTQSQLLSSYNTVSNPWLNDTNFFTSTGGYQYWTVPKLGVYSFTLEGGHGGHDTAAGRPAIVSGRMTLQKGAVLKMLVGQAGLPLQTDGNAAGGGGGTFVTFNDNTPIFVAGGGGGADGGPAGGDAQQGTAGGVDGNLSRAAADNGAGGAAINGAGGGGLTGNGTNGQQDGGLSFTNGGTGGDGIRDGGFGGGGGSAGSSNGGGGGGGYSGGQGGSGSGIAPDTGGGGSFFHADATNTSWVLKSQTEPAPVSGEISITFIE